MPSRLYISKEEKLGFKLVKDRLTLLLCDNAEYDFQCKPLAVYHSQNPRAFRGHSQLALPVHWLFNKKARIIASVF